MSPLFFFATYRSRIPLAGLFDNFYPSWVDFAACDTFLIAHS
jgi:hypothetical protein